MGNYSVVGADGQMYGPVDEATLAQWAQAGRVGAGSQVQFAATGQYMPAGSLPFLAPIFHAASPMPAPAPAMNPYPHGLGYAGPTMSPMWNQFTPFSVPLALLLHYVTFGLFTVIWLNLLHDKMPMVRRDDPSGGKGIGFMFIPIFGPLYWNFFNSTRLCDRINEQRRANGLPDCAPRGLAIAMCVLFIIPYINVLCILIIAPIFLGTIQSGVNELALLRQGQPIGR